MEKHFEDYNKYEAPGILMTNDPQHNATRVTFNNWATEYRKKNEVSEIDWSTVTEKEMQDLRDKQYKAAEIPDEGIREYESQFQKYIKTLKKK